MSDLWVLAGQSNMEGVGNLVAVEEPHPAVSIFAHGDVWRTAEEPLHWLDEAVDPIHPLHRGSDTPEKLALKIATERATRTRGAGCGLPFAKAVHAATGIEIDLLPTAHGGTSMQQWDPAHKHQGGNSLYGAFYRRVKLALETKPSTKLRGILWYQGESDANPIDAPLYQQRMIDLIAAMRSDLDAPDLPFYLVQLGSFVVKQPVNVKHEAAWSEIRDIERRLPTIIPNTAVVPAIDLELSDGIHIDTQGFKRLGKRFANIVLAELYGKPGATPIDVAAIKSEERKITIRFSGVNGTLNTPDPAGRVSGFALSLGGAPDFSAHFRASVTGNAEITLLHDEGASATQVSYGYGYNPFCQLTDSSDMAVPAFGPIAL